MKLAPLLACLPVVVAAVLLAGSAAAQTQTRTATIYRCGPDGRDLRDSPCPASLKASATRLEFDHPSAAQAKAAREQAVAEAKRAQEMEAQRLRDEAVARQHQAARAGGINGLARPAAAKPASAPMQPVPPKSPKKPKLAKPAKPANAAKTASAPR
jgi:hypothetical protein